ncbi:MAG: hypothetical protein RIS84_1303 [Pseudomonadota bacterium]|jgi:uncharacterized protein (DUF302 family)
MIEHKTSYLQPKIIISETAPSFLSYVWRGIKLFGVFCLLLVFSAAIYLYIEGKQVISSFDEEFLGVFSQFVEQVLKQDMARALVVKTPLEQKIIPVQAIEAMKIRAKTLGLKFIESHTLVSATPSGNNHSKRMIEVLEFFDDKVTAQLLEHSPDFAVHLPCRIVVSMDKDGQAWLTTLDLSLLAHGSAHLPPEVKNNVLKLQDDLLRIISAGASGAKE